MDTKMDKKLPYELEHLLQWILVENKVTSWRYCCESNLTLSIRFSKYPAITTSTPQANTWASRSMNGESTVHDSHYSYRLKPPSSVLR